MKVKTAIIIINWNGANLLIDCLSSIRKNTRIKDYKVIVVDNNSTDGSVGMVKKQFKNIDLIQNKKNYGFSKGNNIGIQYAIKKYDPNYFFLLNNDTKVTKSWLNELIKVAESHEKGGIFGCKQLTFQKKPSISAGWILPWGVKYYYGRKVKEVNWVSGACWLIKKEVIEKIGLLDEHYIYYEETDFEQRAIKYGFKIIHVPSSIIYHKGGASFKKLNKDLVFKMFYSSRIRFFLKNFPFYFFLPRILLDFFRALKLKKISLLLGAYKEGLSLLRE